MDSKDVKNLSGMDMGFTQVCLWTLLAFAMTWTTIYVTNMRKKAAKLEDVVAEERRDGGADVIIVGAGVGGSALAYALAKDGRQVHVIERDMRQPERMMGEFMQPGGRLLLSKLGLEDCLKGIDAQIATGVALYKDGKEAVASFPVENNNFPYEPSARSFHNGRFVQRLRQMASSLPNVRLEEGTVKSLIEEKGVVKGVTYKNSSGEETTAFAPLTVVCDGCYSNLRRSLNDSTAEVLSYQVGYISKNCKLEDTGRLQLIMSKPSFTMLYQISSTDVRCVTEIFPGNIPSNADGEMANFFRNTMAPQVPAKLRKIFLKGIDEGAQIKTMPTKRMSATLSEKKGVIVLGDAFNMRHPAIASGMMVLLSDILILRGLLQPLSNLGDTKKISEVIKSFYVIRKPMSATVNTLGNAFSQVLIASTDEAKEAMRQGCYDYLSSGGFRTSGLMALLGGMNPRPLSLIFHLCAITLSSIGQLLSPFPSPLRIWHSLRLFVLSFKMLVPHLKAEGDGRQVHVIERDMRQPERMMGEFMQPGGRLLLSKLGLEDCLEGIDAQIATGLAVYKDGKETEASFPVEDNNNFPYEPNGRSFHNGRFVQRLRQKASSLPKRRLCRTKLNCQLEDPESLKLIMAKPSYVMLYQISSTDVRCVMEIFPGNIPSIANGEMVDYLKNTMAPQVPSKFRKIFLKGIDEGAQIKTMAAKRMEAALSEKKGVIVLGDAFNMRHPAVASGMMVLLSDILILRGLLQPLANLGDANKVSEVIKSFYVIRKPMSATVNTLGNAFSQVLIASTDEAKEAMRQGCYDYLSSGGFRTSGLMAVLGGMNPRPLSLIFHLCAITLSSIGQLLSPFPSPLRIWHSLRLFGEMALPHFWLWTMLVAFVLMWTVFHVSNKRKTMSKLKLEDPSRQERRDGYVDVIIVGAGVGGSALAYALAKDGRRVHVIERDMREPERMMGEVMQPGGRFMLAKLGLQDCLEGIDAQKATGLAVYKDGKEGVLPFPVENNNFPYEPCARSFHNGRFVQRLRQKASSLPNVHVEEGTVKSFIEENGVIKGVIYKNNTCQETTAFAPLAVVCDGCYSNLRRSLVDSTEEVHTYMVGYITRNSRLYDPQSLHLILSRPIVCVMYQISSDEVRCIAEIPADSVPSIANGDMSTFLKKSMAPQLPVKLREIFIKGINDGERMKVVATKSMSAMSSEKKGVIVLGDAFNMRHPIIASGMMVVLSDVLILRHLLKPLGNLANVTEVSEVIKSFNDIRKPMSATANTLGSAFSQVLVASKDEAKEAMRQGCYDYLCSGGFRTSGIMALLGGMNPRPLSLLLHLFAITISSIAHVLSPFPTPLRVWHSLRLFVSAMKMLGHHLKVEGVRQMLSPANAATYHKRYMAATAL
ncbi:unnamed protein product [Thlaspi arvense]|uniref:squalene monooxygenase n=1 Tax=Thlaspi arvense TaxID=13288 RepID=A0AAU9RJX3_THLAR|nr:unnamed protein product [Thlaspi arvense]